MNNVLSDHADELASWGLGEFGENSPPPPPPPYDAPKYTHTSSPAQYEPVVKYGSHGPPPSYVEKYVKRVDDNLVRTFFYTII